MEKLDDSLYEEDRVFLRKVLDIYSEGDRIEFYVNPSVKLEIDATKNQKRRRALQEIFEKFKFIPFNKTIFPFVFPANLLKEEEVKILERLCEENPGLEKDKKIIADATFGYMDILLTTDRRHLANKGIHIQHLKIFTPKELCEYLNNLGLI